MTTKKQTIKCSECEHCHGLRPVGNTRTNFFCKHQDQRYIHDYFSTNRMKKMPGFLGYGSVNSDTAPLKTSPAWCPMKK